MEMIVQLHDPVALPPGKGPLVPVDRKLDGPQNHMEAVKKRRVSGPAGNQIPIPRSFVTIP
jgi:hypothetical protein